MARFRAPGRVNIIGEHTDYNDGFVLPFAIDRYVEAEIRIDNQFVFSSQMMGETIALRKYEQLNKWTDYLMGVIRAIDQKGYDVPPVRINVTSTLPIGAGLSSSAALEIVVAYGLNRIMNLELEKRELVEIAVKAEREFVGVKCGVMDQFTCVFARRNHAILLDTSDLRYEYVPLNVEDFEFALIDSNTKHELSSSEYNKRRKECEEVLKILQKKSFKEVDYEDLQYLEVTLKKRAKHVLDENNRVSAAVKALKSSDASLLGNLLYESHASLRDLYEVSCEETDFIVDFLKKSRNVAGARMIGGGFGGSVLILTKRGCVEDVFEKLEKDYFKAFGKRPKLIKVKSSDGVNMCGA